MPVHARHLLLLVLFLIPSPNSLSAGQDDNTAALGRFWLEGWKAERERLRTGVVRIEGRYLDEKQGRMTVDGQVKIFAAFDYPSGRIRFDRTYPVLWALKDEQGRLRHEVRTSKSKYVRTPERSLRLNRGRHLTVLPPDYRPSEDERPFDIRTAGMGWYCLTRNVSLDEALESRLKPRILEAVSQRDGRRRIVLIYRVDGEQQPVARSTIWLEESQGMAPVRTQLQTRNRNVDQLQWLPPEITCESRWEQVGETWVPQWLRCENTQTAGWRRLYDLTFHWEQVNGEVPEKLFTREGLDPEPGTMIVNRELGKTVVEGVVGRPNWKPPKKRTEPKPSSSRIVVIVASFLAILALSVASVYVIRRGSSQSDKSP